MKCILKNLWNLRPHILCVHKQIHMYFFVYNMSKNLEYIILPKIIDNMFILKIIYRQYFTYSKFFYVVYIYKLNRKVLIVVEKEILYHLSSMAANL